MALSLEEKLNITNTITQVCLLLLAVIGYFYTVIPLYSKAVLEEQVAKIQIDIDEKNKIISSKEKELLEIQNKIEKLNGDNNKLKTQEELTRYRLKLNINYSLHLEKVFCFKSLDNIGGIYDRKTFKINEAKKEEILKEKEKIYNCIKEKITSLELEDKEKEIESELLQTLEQNKAKSFKLFDEYFNSYVANIESEYKLFRKSLKEKTKEIDKYKKSNPQKHQFDNINLLLEAKDFSNKDWDLFQEFSDKARNDFEI